MSKIIFILALFLAACNNSGESSNESTKTGDSSVNQEIAGWPKEEENEFLAGCVDNAKEKLGEEKAFTYCNCVLKQVRQKFPSIDSASTVLMDSTRAAEFTKNCK